MNSVIKINDPLPNWELETIFGEEIPAIEDFKGKPLLILFFNLGCPGCKGRALPFANKMVYENGEKLNVIGIHTRFEGPEFTLDDFRQAQEEYYIRFSFYKDANLSATFRKYLAGGTPHWLLVNAEGNLEYSIFGSDPNNALLRLDFKINELLN
ncbi:TlpA family protein disulfide reductase [Aquimarina sediminis]|uniref:TlpA family protein disulfide reductase n=1 Tax=Aquimarina sediminis TaxID=2070536 RepID=UPI000CA03EFE|nr:TlpA disulfide reductase family protein [Aquimarina sediminis]